MKAPTATMQAEKKPRARRTYRPPLAVEPRLLSDAQAGAYTGTSASYIRSLEQRGLIKRVPLPAAHGLGAEPARRFLVDVRDLDQLIETLKNNNP